MASPLFLRRRAASPQWTPASLSSVVAWWHAGDLPAGSVSSWVDRVGSLAASQGTSANQPAAVTNSLAGQTGVTFNGTSHSLPLAAPGSIPDGTGAMTLITLAKNATGITTNATLFDMRNNLAAKGYGLQYNSDKSAGLTFYGRASNLGPVWVRGYSQLLVASKNAGTSAVTYRGQGVSSNTATSSVQSSANTASIGASWNGTSASQWWAGTLYDLILCAANIPDSDVALLQAWVRSTYGPTVPVSTYNASGNVAAPGKDHAGATTTDAIELGVVYNPSGIFGHSYWLACAPYVAGAPDENPCISFSGDGNTWSQTGISNPIVAYPGGGAAGNNADPSLFDNTARDSKLYCYYVRESATVPANGVRVASTTDGTTWTDLGQIISSSNVGNNYESPVVGFDPSSGNYWCYTMQASSTPQAIYRQSATSPSSASWSAQSQCTINGMSSQVFPWHMSAPIRVNGQWLVSFTDTYNGFGQVQSIWLASSSDGLTWNAVPVSVPGPTVGAWDRPVLYRPAIADAGDGQNLYLWYVAGSGVAGGATFLSQQVTVPLSRVP